MNEILNSYNYIYILLLTLHSTSVSTAYQYATMIEMDEKIITANEMVRHDDMQDGNNASEQSYLHGERNTVARWQKLYSL